MKRDTKEKLVNYFVQRITQRTTWMAIGSAALVILSYAKPEWVPVTAGVLSAFGLVINDKKETK